LELERIWKSWAPGKILRVDGKSATHRKCWTAERLAKKGLPHPALCPLCDQVEETLDHLLVSCVFSRQFWFNLLQGLGLQALAPGLDDEIFDDWWDNLSSRVSCQIRKGANYLVILGAWNLWNHRNMCVFDGAVPDLNSILSTTREDLQLWSIAGTKGVSFLLTPAPVTT